MADRRLAVLLAVGLAFTFPGPASGQQVRLSGEPRTAAQEALRGFLDAERFALWVRDTVLARGDTVPGPVLLLEGTARIAGRIEGDLYVVDGDLFLRSGASVGGDILVIGGGFYDSGLAEVAGAITYRPNELLRVRPASGGFEIFSEIEPEPAFELDGTYGFHLPTYNRVDGLAFPVGALARLYRASNGPEIAAGLTWIPARDDVDFRLHSSWHLGERLRMGLYAASAVASNEEWIRPTWYNSLAHFVAGEDVRSYHDSKEFGLEVEWTSPEPPVWEDAPRWRLVVAGGREEAESLRSREVTILFGEEPPPVFPSAPGYDPHLQADEGSLWFGRVGFEWVSQGRNRRTAFGVGVELGLEDDINSLEVLGSAAERSVVPVRRSNSYDFLLVEGRVSTRRVTPWGHVVDGFAIGRLDVTGRLPRQRYSTIGGIGTLPTMPVRGLRGPRLFYAEAAYAIPLLGDAALGGVDAFVRGSAGGVDSQRGGSDGHATVQGGLALRLWDVRLEFGVAARSTAEPDDPGVIAFMDVRTRRSARPTRMPRPR